MLIINCRNTIFYFDESTLNYFPYIKNIFNNKEQFNNYYVNDNIFINIDPNEMSQLMNFYIMPKYKISNKYLYNTKNLATFMGKDILKTTENSEEIIKQIYSINNCFYRKTIKFSIDHIPKQINTVKESFYFKYNNNSVKLLFYGHPMSNGIHKTNKDGKGRIGIDMLFNMDNNSILSLNNMLFNNTITNKYKWTFNYEMLL